MRKQTVLITGGSKGLGFEIASIFLNKNYDVIICSRNKNNLNKAINKLKKKSNFVHGFVCDLTNIEDLSKLKNKINKKFNGIDILIHNAGGGWFEKKHDIKELSFKNYSYAFKLNNFPLFFFTKNFLRQMIKRKFGRIIFISSISAKKIKSKPWYVSSKLSSVIFLKSMSTYSKYTKLNITFNSISPGFFLKSKKLHEIKKYKKKLKKIPSKKTVTMKEISELIIFLSKKENSSITGQDISIDGGESAREQLEIK